MSDLWEKIKGFVKRNWQVILLVVALVIGYMWLRNRDSEWARLVDNLNNNHYAEIDKINKLREEEAKQHAEQVRILQESLAKIEANYKKAVEDLEKEKTSRQKEIVRKYGNDANGLADLMADSYGFIVKPAE